MTWFLDSAVIVPVHVQSSTCKVQTICQLVTCTPVLVQIHARGKYQPLIHLVLSRVSATIVSWHIAFDADIVHATSAQ